MASANAKKVLELMSRNSVSDRDAMLAEACLLLLEDLGTDGSEANAVDDVVVQLQGHVGIAADGTDAYIVQRVRAYLNQFRRFFAGE